MKLRGITDSGLRRIAKKMGMPFLADPPVPQHEKYKGIIEYPGFHTTESFDIAASYAASRVSSSYTKEDENGTNYVIDYPVVVALDMTGHTPDVDYDAVEMVAPVLETHLDEMINNHSLDEDSSDDEIRDGAQDIIDFAETEYEELDDPVYIIAEQAMYNMKNPLINIYEKTDFPEAVREYMRGEKLTDGILMKMLMDATNQYRYTKDVNENRIIGVWFITPVATDIIDEKELDEKELDDKWSGFDVFSRDELYEGVSYNSIQVYENAGYDEDVEQLSLFTREQLAVEPNIQYHGTTYKRLLEAAPFLNGVLPAPPSPPYQG